MDSDDYKKKLEDWLEGFREEESCRFCGSGSKVHYRLYGMRCGRCMKPWEGVPRKDYGKPVSKNSP